MRVVIAGSRSITDYSYFLSAIEAVNIISSNDEIVSGGAKGVDTLAKQYALDNKLVLCQFLPEYNKYPGRVAPLKRNEDMAEYGDVLIAIWDGKSTGTGHMISQMKKRGKAVYIVKKED